MAGRQGYGQDGVQPGSLWQPDEVGVAVTPSRDRREMTESERETVLRKGGELAELGTGGGRSPHDGPVQDGPVQDGSVHDGPVQDGAAWLLVSGRFVGGKFGPGNGESTEGRVQASLQAVFDYPEEHKSNRTINVLLDSVGGNLDSAFRTVLYLNCYAQEVNVYVPRRAKSASTLLALGADRVYLSAFGELGPLDTQIDDPRNPAKMVSALDCYQSVDYVRNFGFTTMTDVLKKLVSSTEGRIALDDLLDTASDFAQGAISPILQTVTALDFGGWGRSLKIGELYARTLLLAKDDDSARADHVATRLVYGYTHHLFPIDYEEATRIGLSAEKMGKEQYDKAAAVVAECDGRDFVGFISRKEAELEKEKKKEEAEREAMASRAGAGAAGRSLPDEKASENGGLKAPQQDVVPSADLGVANWDKYREERR